MFSTMATALSQIPTTDYRLGFQSQEEETAVERLPVQGEVPAWLTGSLDARDAGEARGRGTGGSATGSTASPR